MLEMPDGAMAAAAIFAMERPYIDFAGKRTAEKAVFSMFEKYLKINHAKSAQIDLYGPGQHPDPGSGAEGMV